MKVLKVTFEIPLGGKTAIEDMQAAAKHIADFTTTLAEKGFNDVLRTESIVTRPGRDQ